MNDNNYSQNPTESFSATNNRKETFCLVPEFTIANINGDEDNSGESPGKIDSKFSRVRVTILGKGKGSAYANVPYGDWANIEGRTRNAELINMQSAMFVHVSPAPSAEPSEIDPVVNTQMQGKMKGLTAAQAYLQKGENAIKDQINWLEGNLGNEKYRKANEEQIRALKKALELGKAGKLTSENAAPSNASAGRVITIYEASLHGNMRKPHPNVKGHYFVFDLKVSYEIGKNYPVKVVVRNYYSPITRTDSGSQLVNASSKIDEKAFEYSLSEADWDAAIKSVNERRDIFLKANATQILNNINKVCKANADAAKAKKANGGKNETAPVTEPTGEIVSVRLKTDVLLSSRKIRTQGKFTYVPCKTEEGEGFYMVFEDADKISWFEDFKKSLEKKEVEFNSFKAIRKDNCFLYVG